MEIPPTSPTLLGRLRDPGDESAWVMFIQLYEPLVRWLTRRFQLNSHDSDDATAIFLQRMLLTLPRFEYDRSRGRFHSFVFTVASNEIRQILNKRKRDGVLKENLRDLGSTVDPGLEKEWEKEHGKRILSLALDRLRQQADPVHWSVFVEAVLKERPNGEAGAFFGRNAQQVSVIKFRLLRRLESIAEDLKGEWDDV